MDKDFHCFIFTHTKWDSSFVVPLHHLYDQIQCRLHDAIQVLESLIRTDPTSFLTERMALNLCTLYELSADSTAANRKKRTLQLIAKRFFLHDVGPESFRIGP